MDDLRHSPLYSIPECARYLGLPVSTVRGWISAPKSDREDDGRQLVKPAGSDPTALSFTNLLEVFVLTSLRRNRAAPTKELLKSVLSMQRCDDAAEGSDLPRADFCRKRIEYNDAGAPIRFYPFTRGFGREDPRLVVIDPAVSFGSPVVAGSGVRTKSVAKFFVAGETIAELADEYRLCPAQIEEAVRYELAV